jgi:polyisoprenoid-binding protein YceI
MRKRRGSSPMPSPCGSVGETSTVIVSKDEQKYVATYESRNSPRPVIAKTPENVIESKPDANLLSVSMEGSWLSMAELDIGMANREDELSIPGPVEAVTMRHLRLFAVSLAVLLSTGVRGASTTYRVDPAKSHATIHVGKAGAFSFLAGHTHEVSGPIEAGSVDVDADAPAASHVRLVIAAAALKVSAAGEPQGDAPKVQEAMDGDKVLDVARYPRITYESTSVVVKNRTESQLDLNVAGRLMIRDVTEPVVVPVRVALSGTSLTATGRITIKQSAFGIKPISVGGVVAVKDTLDIDFSISATK